MLATRCSPSALQRAQDRAPSARRIVDESAPTSIATCRTCEAMVASPDARLETGGAAAPADQLRRANKANNHALSVMATLQPT